MDDNDIYSVRGLKLEIATDKYIEERSAQNEGVTTSVLRQMDEEKAGGLICHKLGSSNGEICKTCKQQDGCITHTTYIDMGKYITIINPYYYDVIFKILNCICFICGKIVKDNTQGEVHDQKIEALRKLPKNMRLSKLVALTSKVKSCSKEGYGCSPNIMLPEISKLKKNEFPLHQYKLWIGGKKKQDVNNVGFKETNNYLDGKQVYDILSKIKDSDWSLMGFNPNISRPEDLLIRSLPISARSTRLTHINDNKYSEDDLLIFQRDIMKKVEDLSSHINKGSEIEKIEKVNWFINFFVHTMMNNTHSTKNRHRNSYAPLRSIHERIDKKTGLMRKHLSGKRVGLSARSVISGDPDISIDQVHIPKEHAMKLDFPVVVTAGNIDYLQTLVDAGPKVYPGANRIQLNNAKNNVISLKYANNRVELKIGYTVYRHLQDDDYIMLNRQPSLHKDSIQAHRVKVRKKGLTIGLSVIATEPYNADFDGDEMVLFAMHNIQSSVEIEHLASIKNNIMSTGKSKTNYGLNEDSLVGAYVLTQPGTILTKKEAITLLSRTLIPIEKLANILVKDKYTGHEIISILLPDKLHYTNGNLNIENGVCVSGYFDKKNIGTGRDSLINTIYYLVGNKETLNFVNNIQKLCVTYLVYYGFTVGLRDIYVPNEIRTIKRKFMDEFIKNTDKMLLTDNGTDNLNDSTISKFEQLEERIFSRIKQMRSEAGDIIQKHLETDNGVNNVLLMQKSGSKGKKANLAQMVGCVGQQEIFLNNKSSRVQRFCGGRVFPKFAKNDLSSEAGGNVISSFIEGMSHAETFVHAYSGRINMIDKGIGTADTGYIQRKLIKCLEGTVLQNDFSVRNANNQIVQMMSGSGAINPSDIIEMEHPMLYMSNKEIQSSYCYAEGSKHYKNMLRIRDEMRIFSQKYWSTRSEYTNKFMVPFNIHQIIDSYLNRQHMKVVKDGDILTVDEIEKIVNRIHIIPEFNLSCISNNDEIEVRKMKNELGRHMQKQMFWFLETELSPKLLRNKKITSKTLENIIETCIYKYQKARHSPGELVGIIAAQTIGEPTTQMNLNAFHSAGVSGDNVSNLSLKRVKELMNLTEGSKLKAPQMKLYFKNETQVDRKRVQKIANVIKCIYLNNVSIETEIIYDPESIHVPPDQDVSLFNMKLWTFIFKIPKTNLENLNLTYHNIENGIQSFCTSKTNKNFVGSIYFKKVFDSSPSIFTVDNGDNWHVVVKFSIKSIDQSSLIEMARIMEESVQVTGIDNISETYVVESDFVTSNQSGEIEKKKEFYIITDGVNMNKLLYLKDLDTSRLFCNDFYASIEMFGIEGVRKMLFDEYRAIVCSNDDINHSHIAILVDFMCHKAGMVAMTASKNKGVNTLKIDPLTKASFEETTNYLMDSALYNQVDHMQYVGSSVIAGQLAKAGSGFIEIGINHRMIQKYAPLVNKNSNSEKIRIIDDSFKNISKPDLDINQFSHNFKL